MTGSGTRLAGVMETVPCAYAEYVRRMRCAYCAPWMASMQRDVRREVDDMLSLDEGSRRPSHVGATSCKRKNYWVGILP